MNNVLDIPFFFGLDRYLEEAGSSINWKPATQSYPPYNIIKSEDGSYVIEVAIAGFTKDDIKVFSHNGALTICGDKGTAAKVGQTIHRGISAKPFKLVYKLADNVKVDSVSMANGMLEVRLVTITREEDKPRQYKIS